MKSRDVIGRTIVAVEQERFWNESTNQSDVYVTAFLLDNGKRVNLIALDDGYDPYVVVTVTRPD